MMNKIIFNKQVAVKEWCGRMHSGTQFSIKNIDTGLALKDCFIPVENADDGQCLSSFTTECMAKIDDVNYRPAAQRR
jgi:hypothetical protein